MPIIIGYILMLMGFASMSTVFLYIYDGYKQKNIKKGVYYVIGFFGLLIIGKVALNIFGIWLAMATPILIVQFLIISYLAKKVND